MFDDRTYKILEAAIQEFISEGEPVSSKQISKKYKFGVKDATIRSELNSLTESGFLNQPHTSGGRVPTDKGYQFLANKIMQDFFDASTRLSINPEHAEWIDSVDNFHHHFNRMINILENDRWTNVIDQVSQNMRLLSAGYKNNGNETYKTGLNELFERLEVRSHADFCQIAKDFEMLDEKLEKLPNILSNSDSPKIFIGKKSPITESEHLSVIIDSYDVDGNRFYLAAIGPKRMDYEKNIKYLKKVKDSIKN